MLININDWPLLLLAAMMLSLLIVPKAMMTICSVAGLIVLVATGNTAPDIIKEAGPSIATVYIVMSTTQIAIKKILQGGAGDKLSLWVAAIATHHKLRRIPASILLPVIFIPAAMFFAMFLHNITAILVLTPLFIFMAKRWEVNPTTTLSAMLIASNLGGASMAFGDTPAIIQRQLWGFSPATFAIAMLPRNLIVLAVLVLIASWLTWLPSRNRQRMEWQEWIDMMSRLKTYQEMQLNISYLIGDRRQAKIGLFCLIGFILGQFFFPTQALALGSLFLIILISTTPNERRAEAFTALGLEVIIVLLGLFLVGKAVEHTPFVEHMTHYLAEGQSRNGIEIIAYFMTGGISADGAATTLAPIVFKSTHGSMISAWALAGGICAGSSIALTSASAGPIINSISKASGHELTFRDYAKLGTPFSIIMLVIYIVYVRIFG
jgi:Na+/H+ antiporter NhaD/arsenite permease-like protein